MHSNLGPMKYQVGEAVRFKFNDEVKVGKISIADFGGSLEMLGKCHSYDIAGQLDGKPCLFKHIPEADVLPAE